MVQIQSFMGETQICWSNQDLCYFNPPLSHPMFLLLKNHRRRRSWTTSSACSFPLKSPCVSWLISAAAMPSRLRHVLRRAVRQIWGFIHHTVRFLPIDMREKYGRIFIPWNGGPINHQTESNTSLYHQTSLGWEWTIKHRAIWLQFAHQTWPAGRGLIAGKIIYKWWILQPTFMTPDGI